MNKYSGPEDIYSELVENQPEDEEWLLGLVAFAVVEEQRIEWVKYQLKNNGRIPSQEEIDNWYMQLPPGVLLRARDTAEARLTDYGKNAIDDFMSDFQRETEEGIIIGEIREIKKFWPQFGVNLAGGFVSALLFALLLTLFAFFVFYNTSPVELGAEMAEQLQENNDG